MCQQILQFCSGSTKLLLFAGAALTLSLAIAIGFTGCTSHAIYEDIDEGVAKARSLSYYLHLVSAAYLMLVTALVCYAAQYDQKHTIRALAVITSVNVVLALAAIAMNPSPTDITSGLDERLQTAAGNYDFTDRTGVPNVTAPQVDQQPPRQPQDDSGRVANLTQPTPRAKREDRLPINGTVATKMWDSLQRRGCCGWSNATETWHSKLPKSCCSEPIEKANEWTCKDTDVGHKLACRDLIGNTSIHELIVLALVAITNIYLAIITGISVYRTIHYNEASQTAYN